MVHNISVKVIDILINKQLLNEREREICCYGLETTMEKGICYFWIILLAIYFKILFPTVLFLLFFLNLRKYSGGFHAATYFGCFTGTLLIYILTMFCLRPVFLLRSGLFFFLLVFSACIIWFLAPVNHPNMSWNKTELSECRFRTRITLTFELISIAVACILPIDLSLPVSAGLGIIICGWLLLIAKILKQEVLNDG